MKIEKLRKNHKKEIIIGTILAVVIGGALTFKLTHSKYRVTQSIDLATGTINYTVPDFKIMAMYQSEDGENYNETTTMPTSGYVINEEKTYCRTSSGNEVKGKIKTENGKHYISGLNKGDKCYLYFDKIIGISASELLATVKSKSNGTKSSFNTTATTNEGIFEVEDSLYGTNVKSYYWRGAVTDNHVIFANYCWRIIRINGDGTIRMIYNGTVQSGNTCLSNGNSGENVQITKTSAYNTSSASYYVGWTQNGSQKTLSGTDSTIKGVVDTWYNDNIGSNDDYNDLVVNGKFCNDRDTASGYSWSATGTSSFNYAAYGRLETNKTPTLSCSSGDVYSIKVGLITADEVMYAGGDVYSNSNYNYYLYSSQWYWTMSPGKWSNSKAYVYTVFRGSLLAERASGPMMDSCDSDVCGFGIRPVINLSNLVIFNQGATGEASSPYVVK